jgi:glycerol-1-phosphate dehydrogenase [NAD(P)+]
MDPARHPIHWRVVEVAFQLDRAAIDLALAQASTTRVLVLESQALRRVGPLVGEHAPGTRAVLVYDDTTWEIAGRAVRASLDAAGVAVADEIRLTGSPQVTPDLQQVGLIRQVLEAAGEATLPLAIGSGTINDLTKRGAFEVGLPYAVVATAASMDGYTASGAALIADGVKQTFACDAPVMVIADREVIAQAPPPMTASGYGDLLGKMTAGADWLVADALGIEPIDRDAWASVQGPLRGLLARPERYASGDAGAIEQLFLALAGSGLAIQATGSSRPASGSEHQFSHFWEMRGLEIGGIPVSHGFKVGIGSVVAAALYERLLRRDLSAIDVESLVAGRTPWPRIAAEVESLHPPGAIRDKALEEMEAKYVSDAALAERLARLREGWSRLRSDLERQLLPPGEIAAMLAAAGCPATPAQIGLDAEQARLSYRAAMQIRRRYTVYDLAQDVRLLDELVDELFRSDGYWASAMRGGR